MTAFYTILMAINLSESIEKGSEYNLCLGLK